MSDLRTAAQQALEALERGLFKRELIAMREQAIAALRAALAEPVQEPDSPERRCGGPGCDGTCCQPVEEPVAFSVGRTLHWHEGKGVSDAQLFAAPPQRPVEPVQEPVEPVAYIHRQGRHWEVSERPLADDEKARGWTEEPLYTSPPQRPAEPVQEPVAWLYEARHIDSAWAAAVTLKHPGPEGVYMRNVTPLYAAPPQRKPLAEWQINDLMTDIDPEDRDSWSFRQGVYAAEKHHGVRK